MTYRDSFRRRTALAVNIGGIPLGSDYPVRIQSMANTLTSDIKSSAAQCRRIADAGADYVRLTVPSLADADAFGAIKDILRKDGYNTPLIADVHFNPDIALKVADYADKVRINPGNFSSKEKFIQLVEKCRSLSKVIRVGVNHGSLSQIIMDKYGDTPEGMAESAMEYLRICRDLSFNQVVVSMKSSNVRVMIYANRLISDMMEEEGMHFPLHLGVTEAGEGEDGRIKSAVGIGTLLAEGLGDTIRVSLTEEPEAEIPVARRIVEEGGREGERERGRDRVSLSLSGGKYEFELRKSRRVGNVGGGQVPVVYGFDRLHESVKLVQASEKSLDGEIISLLTNDRNTVLVYTVSEYMAPAELNTLRNILEQKTCDVPVIFRMVLNETSEENFMIKTAISLGGAFIDGFGDGIWLENELSTGNTISTSLGILQACRARMSKTEFIACPSCGRTNFNLMETLALIKKATGHLKGLKIGVMGCIVNGPGEMADADYGYVGSGMGKVTLYKGREVFKKGIPEDRAVEELVALIKENGDWVEE